MNLLIATRADKNIKDMTDLTHPIIKNYAKKCDADFKQIDHEQTVCTKGDGKWHYRIMITYDLLDEYDRILWLDSDIIIAPNCPNIFKIVPANKIGTIFEDKGSRRMHRRSLIDQVQQEWGHVGWFKGYINTGVFVVSKMHKEIFQPHDGVFWTGFGFDDILFGYNIHKYNFKIHELPFQYNHMSMFSEDWNCNADKFDSFIIHYAGRAARNNEQIKEDIKYLYEDI